MCPHFAEAPAGCARRIPALLDGDVRVFESGAIMLYLAQKHPEAGLYSQVLVYCLSMSAPWQL